MAYKSLSGDIKQIRNAIQDSTANPYANSTKFDHATKYVFAFTKKPAGGSPTDAELYAKANREKALPIIVDVMPETDDPQGMHGGKIALVPVVIRCFVTSDTTLTFAGTRMEAQELALEKLNEVRYQFMTNASIQATFAGAGLSITQAGYGGIRPVSSLNGQDFGYTMTITFHRTMRT